MDFQKVGTTPPIEKALVNEKIKPALGTPVDSVGEENIGLLGPKRKSISGLLLVTWEKMGPIFLGSAGSFLTIILKMGVSRRSVAALRSKRH